MRRGCSGSRSAWSKSITASKAPPVRIHSLTAARLVHDPKQATAAGDNAAGELVRPAAEGIVGRDVAICDRVAEGDDAANADRGLDVDAAEEEPVIDHATREHHLLGGEVAWWRN